MKVVIGITCGCEDGSIVQGWPLIYVNRDLVRSIEAAGAIPVLLPVLEDERGFEHYVEMIDGIVIAGEVLSIISNVLGENRHENLSGNDTLERLNPLRYKNEKAAIRAALKRNIPVLGICRGHQVLSVAEGGSLKDHDITVGNSVMHHQGTLYPPDKGVHRIDIRPGSRLHRMLQADQVDVNSFHRQAVQQVPEGYIVSATSADGNIEAIESQDDRFVMGLQFHPEMMKGEIWQQFFKEFVEVVRQNARQRLGFR